MDNETYVVVGAGHAGGRAVEAMRNAGFEGRIVLVGAESHLPYERPPLSKELLQAKPDYSFPHIRPIEYFEENGIDLKLGNAATSIDTTSRTVILTDGESIEFSKLLLTTGGKVRRISVPGADLPSISYLRTLDDAKRIDSALGPGKELVVIGGGFIGLEVAASARNRGTAVTVFELADRLMGRGVPPSISAHFLELHRKNGVKVHLETGIGRIENSRHGATVIASNGNTVSADAIVVGIGIYPDASLAENAGIRVDDGILVDEFCRTSEADIFAAGDATRHYNPLLGRHVRLETWQCAQNMAIAAARIMCGMEEPYAEIPWMWTDQFETNLQIAGVPKSWDGLVIRGKPASGSFIGFILENDAIAGAISVNQPRDMRLARRMMESKANFTAEELLDPNNSLRDLSKR